MKIGGWDPVASIKDVGSVIAAPFNQAASSLTGGKVGGSQGLSLKNVAGDIRGAINNPIINPIGGITKAATGGRITPMDLAGAGAVALGGYYAAPYMGFGAPATGTSAAVTDASLTSDPVLAGEAGQAWAPSAGGAVESAPPLADTAATAGATAKAGMSTAQKIALGLMGVNALTGKKQALNPDLMAGATPAQTTANNIMDQYNKGQLNAADQYSIAKWAQDSKAKKQQYYAQAGLSDSSMAQQDIAGIDAQAGAMRDQALNNMLQSGLNAAGIANSATGQAVQLQMQQDQAQQQAQQQFFELLAYSLA